jgi:competence protein ComFC
MKSSREHSINSKKWFKILQNWKRDLLHLIYPSACLICEKELLLDQTNICSFCEHDLRFTFFENYLEPTSLDQLFWGRAQLTSTCAFLYFEKGTSTQQLLHAIKYQNKQELAIDLGRRFGEKLLENEAKYGTIEALIPIPLHPKKQFIRGYNQSECIANGIASSIQTPVVTTFLTKGKHTESQTKKGRFLRWDNVTDVFQIHPATLNGMKHIALVDDVVTTGSTLEACIQLIHQQIPNIQISVLSLAIAK